MTNITIHIEKDVKSFKQKTKKQLIFCLNNFLGRIKTHIVIGRNSKRKINK